MIHHAIKAQAVLIAEHETATFGERERLQKIILEQTVGGDVDVERQEL